MVKKMLLAAALIAALIPFANAQDAKTLTRAVTPQTLGAAKAPTAEAPCSPCLFYGGDWPVASTSWVAFGNGNEYYFGTVYNYTNYVPFKVPTGAGTWNVKALFTNNIFYNYVTATNSFKLDPNTSEWTINQGVSTSGGGTVVASGTATGNFRSTGRVYSGFYFEYSVIAGISHTGIPLSPGEYWLGVAGDCTDSSCEQFMYNTDTFGGATYNAYGPPEPKCQSYQNYAEGGTWVNDCNQGYGKGISAYMSAGVIGTH